MCVCVLAGRSVWCVHTNQLHTQRLKDILHIPNFAHSILLFSLSSDCVSCVFRFFKKNIVGTTCTSKAIYSECAACMRQSIHRSVAQTQILLHWVAIRHFQTWIFIPFASILCRAKKREKEAAIDFTLIHFIDLSAIMESTRISYAILQLEKEEEEEKCVCFFCMRNSTQTNNKSIPIMYQNLPLFHLHWKRVCISTHTILLCTIL